MTEDGSCSDTLMKQAADAIEELQQIAAHYEEAAKDYFKDVCYYLERVPKWIPVTERLPSKGTNVLVYEFGRVEQAYITTCTADSSPCWVVINGYSYHRISDADCPIKWWMPLPEPPKEE
jgi:hypothetical protein